MKTRKHNDSPSMRSNLDSAQPVLHQRARETQNYDAVTRELPLGLPAEKRQEIVQLLNQILADTMSLRDLYKKNHWQVSGPTFYQLHFQIVRTGYPYFRCSSSCRDCIINDYCLCHHAFAEHIYINHSTGSPDAVYFAFRASDFDLFSG